MSDATKERLRLARLAAKIRGSKTEELSEHSVTHEADDWIEVVIRIRRPPSSHPRSE